MFELIIHGDNEKTGVYATRGLYESRLQAMDAADDAFAELTADYGNPNSGFLRDDDGRAWFHFEIRQIDQ